MTFNGEPVPDDMQITLGINDYFLKNAISLFGEEIKTLTGCTPVKISDNAVYEMEQALNGKENIALASERRFKRIFADGSVLCP